MLRRSKVLPTPILFSRGVLPFACLVLAGTTSATTIDWAGSTSTTWATGSNWSGGVAPTNDTTTDLARFNFTTAPAFAPNGDSQSIGGVIIGDGTTAVAAFTLSGTHLTIGASGVTKHAASLATTFATPTTLAASQSWTNAASTMLNVTGAITGGASSLTITGSGNTTLAGALAGSGSLIKTGNGTLYLTGINGFTGGIYLRGGILESGGSGKKETLGPDSGSLYFDGAGATLRLASTVNSSPHNYVFTQTGTVNTNGFNLTLHGTQAGAGGLTKIGTGKLALHGTATYAGLTTVSAGTLEIGAAGALTSGAAVQVDNVAGATFAITANQTIGALNGGGTTGGSLSLDGSTLTVGSGNVSSTWSGTITGSSGSQLIKTGTGTLTLTHTATNNAFTGNVGIAGGTLRISAAESLGKLGIANVLDLSNGGMLETTANLAFDTRHVHLGVADANGVAGAIQVASGTTTYVRDTVMDNTNGATGALLKTGAGTLVLEGSNTYTGGTIIAEGRVIAGTNGNRSTLGDSAGALTFAGLGATLQLAGTVTNSTRAYHFLQTGTIDTAGYDLVLGGTRDGAGGLTKTGLGTLTLTGNSTYTGTTTALAGTLVVNGTLAGDLVVDAAATLGGAGTLGGNVEIKGRHNPGNSPGVQVIAGSLTYDAGASVTWELGTNGASNTPTVVFDQITVGTDLVFAGATGFNLSFNPTNTISTVDWTNAFWDTQQQWIVYSVTGTTTGFGSLSLITLNWLDGNGLAFSAARATGHFALTQQGSDVVLTYTAVPESSTYGLALGGLALALGALRRRASKLKSQKPKG